MDKEISSCSPTVLTMPLHQHQHQHQHQHHHHHHKDGDDSDDDHPALSSPCKNSLSGNLSNTHSQIPSIMTLSSLSSSSHQTPHRRIPHHHLGNNNNNNNIRASSPPNNNHNHNHNNHTNHQHHQHFWESPGISKLWKPALSPPNHHTASPRRVLYPSPTKSSSCSSRRFYRLFNFGTGGSGSGKPTKRSARVVVTTYLTIAIGLALLSYFYLASFLLIQQDNSNHNSATRINNNNPNNHYLLEQLANQPLPLSKQAQQPHGKTMMTTSIIQNNEKQTRTRWQRQSSSSNTKTQQQQQQQEREQQQFQHLRSQSKVVLLARPRVVALDDPIITTRRSSSSNHGVPTAASASSLTLKLPLGPIDSNDREDEQEEEHVPLIAPITNYSTSTNHTNNNNTNTKTNTNTNTTDLHLFLFGNSSTIAMSDSDPYHNNSNSEDTGGTGGTGGDEDKGDVLDFENPDEQELIDECEAAEEWQTQAHPNCNTLHEVDMNPVNTINTHGGVWFLGQGWFRSTWRLDSADVKKNSNDTTATTTTTTTTTTTSVVIKMLRLEREFLDEYYELHRRDAVAMDHLTFSPFIMNVYGYCGQSAINELAAFKEGVNALEQLDRRLRGKDGDGVLLLKLRLALSVSIGLYHVHYGIPGLPWEQWGGNVTAAIANPPPQNKRPTMAHYDINPRNIAIVAGGKPKLNDFNIAEFLRYPKESNNMMAEDDATTNTTSCGFPSRLHEPWWRAPEEVDINATTTQFIDEKVDVYALGAVLYHIFTTHSPRGKMKKERMAGIREEVRKGIRPTLTEPWKSRKEPVAKAFRDAMDLCFHVDPKKRGTSAQVASILYRGLQEAPPLPKMEAHKAVDKDKDKHRHDSKHHDKQHHDDKKNKEKTDHKHDDSHHR